MIPDKTFNRKANTTYFDDIVSMIKYEYFHIRTENNSVYSMVIKISKRITF